MSAREASPTPPTAPVLVLGVGNPLRQDEGFGVHAVRRLAREPLPPNVRVEDGGTDGAGLIDLLRGHERVVLFDLVRPSTDASWTAPATGGMPRRGDVVVFRLSSDGTAAPRSGGLGARSSPARFSLHGASIEGSLALARALDLPLPPIWVVGLVSDAVGWSTELSAHGERAMERALSEARRLLAGAAPIPEREGR